MQAILLGVMSLLVVTSIIVQWKIITPGFLRIERTEAQEDLDRCTEALQRECEHLCTIVLDWAAWDDTYQFMQGKNDKFQAVNLIPATFSTAKVDLLAFFQPDGKMVWGETRDCRTTEPIEITGLLSSFAHNDHPLLKLPDLESDVHGILVSAQGPMLIASRPIVTSDRKGPSQGTMIMGRLLRQTDMEEMAKRTRVTMSFRPVESITSPSDKEVLAQLTAGSKSLIRSEDLNELRGYALVRDLFGKPALLLEARMDRRVSRNGAIAAQTATASIVVGVLVAMVVLWVWLCYRVVRPLGVITRHTERVGSQEGLRTRLKMARKDEIGVLAREFDRMVDALAEARRHGMDMSRQAGMAEVATDVLHNVGNVLSTVNISAEIVAATLRDSEVSSLGLAAQMLSDHKDDLANFLTRDSKGRQLPAFLGDLAKVLAEERNRMTHEMGTVNGAIEHIKAVIQLQQVHDHDQVVIEPVSLAQIIEEALRPYQVDMDQQGIRVVRQFGNVSDVYTDRHKLIQILGNLISNARNAVCDSGRPDKQITLTAQVAPDRPDRVRIIVADNGVGIEPANLLRVFAFGFSMRPNGHGYGLHSAANIAAQMAGALAAFSEGPGKGATFVVELPVHVQREAA
jgi:sensor domain CHASE-containing protein